jgi:hypothetical protein
MLILFLFGLLVLVILGTTDYLFGRQCGQYDVVCVGKYDRLGFFAAGEVNGTAVILGILHQSFDGCGIGCGNQHYALTCDKVGISCVYEFHSVVSLFYVLYLLTYFFKLALAVDYQLCNI